MRTLFCFTVSKIFILYTPLGTHGIRNIQDIPLKFACLLSGRILYSLESVHINYTESHWFTILIIWTFTVWINTGLVALCLRKKSKSHCMRNKTFIAIELELRCPSEVTEATFNAVIPRQSDVLLWSQTH